LSQLTGDADMVYCVDTYGIYYSEWYTGTKAAKQTGIIYGGLSEQDIALMSKMKTAHKLVIAGLNCLNAPTPPDLQDMFEQLFNMHWTGWIGRYFSSFDTAANRDLPLWLVQNYKARHNNQWPFTRPGIALVNKSNEVVILEEGISITQPFPMMVTTAYGHEHFRLPRQLPYTRWFDITDTDTAVNTIIASFVIDATKKGKNELAARGIPLSFPAIQAHKGADYSFYYFSGNFCDNHISMASSCFKGVQCFKSFLSGGHDASGNVGFFWLFYRPLIVTILADYYKGRK